MFLFRAVVFASTGHTESKQVAVELQTGVGVGDGDRGVVDPEKKTIRGLVPLGISFVGRKLQDFQRMIVRVPEIEGSNSTGILVPIGQKLWTGGRMFDFVAAKNRVGAVHVADDDCDVLEPQVIAS